MSLYHTGCNNGPFESQLTIPFFVFKYKSQAITWLIKPKNQSLE
jgi:hypothetical protein